MQSDSQHLPRLQAICTVHVWFQSCFFGSRRRWLCSLSPQRVRVLAAAPPRPTDPWRSCPCRLARPIAGRPLAIAVATPHSANRNRSQVPCSEHRRSPTREACIAELEEQRSRHRWGSFISGRSEQPHCTRREVDSLPHSHSGPRVLFYCHNPSSWHRNQAGAAKKGRKFIDSFARLPLHTRFQEPQLHIPFSSTT